MPQSIKGDEIAKAGMRNENLMKETVGEKIIIVLHGRQSQETC